MWRHRNGMALKKTPLVGISNSTTQRSRAIRIDALHAASTQKDRALAIVTGAGPNGVTSSELGSLPGWKGHGGASGVLTKLHDLFLITRVRETRGGSEIYVLEAHVNGRRTTMSRKNLKEAAESLTQAAAALTSITGGVVTAPGQAPAASGCTCTAHGCSAASAAGDDAIALD